MQHAVGPVELETVVRAVHATEGRAAKVLRIASGRRQQEVEVELGLTRGLLSKLEGGLRPWSPGLVELLLEELAVGEWEVAVAGLLCARLAGGGGPTGSEARTTAVS
jgi:transcriptional regulator with XRE-family HTH domain